MAQARRSRHRPGGGLMNSSPRSNDPLTLLTDCLRATWGTGRRWTPGEATWAVTADGQMHRVESLGAGAGVCWLRPHDVVIVATTIEEVHEGLRLARRSPVQIPAADETLRSAADRAGWRPLVGASFDLDLRLGVAHAQPAASMPCCSMRRRRRTATNSQHTSWPRRRTQHWLRVALPGTTRRSTSRRSIRSASILRTDASVWPEHLHSPSPNRPETEESPRSLSTLGVTPLTRRRGVHIGGLDSWPSTGRTSTSHRADRLRNCLSGDPELVPRVR